MEGDLTVWLHHGFVPCELVEDIFEFRLIVVSAVEGDCEGLVVTEVEVFGEVILF